ncbi:hypothetical protein DSL72_000615 [Monilinia vaccinii-corymbosi]|uniref:Uncharacterized protein n=1 Tax=Monilinia vaccinii-corymbosi TaxID=61207 RepID=A0A8A3P4L9_9HELO|nr:hypothetical protein DSL72_000615 [Monilinia vaccinii-corymbosi]
MRSTLFYSVLASGITSVLGDVSISTFPNSLNLAADFDPIKPAYWTVLAHHRRTPLSVSPDGKSAYIAYLDSTYAKVHVQQVSLTDFSAVGEAVSVTAYEAAGLVAQNDGFALMATVKATGTDLPKDNAPIVSIIRYKNGVKSWETPLNGPGVHPSQGLTATPDANGDLVYSAKAGLYAGYFVVEAYTGEAAGHFGDSIQYVDDNGALKNINGASSYFGCSHNTGIALEAADEAPFASCCAEDQGGIWLNTETQYMSGQKIANENTTNGASGEPMGGMSGSYSNLASIPGSTGFVFAWQSRGALDLTANTWLGDGYTHSSPRWLNHNVAISVMTDKKTLAGAQASSTVGAAEGDTQVNWITYSSTEDHENVHIAAVNSEYLIVTYETLTSPNCQPLPLGCTGTYAGTSFQVIDSKGTKVGSATVSKEAFVSGDIITIGTDKVCWPYVEMTWDLSAPKDSGTPVSKMSFACASLSGNTTTASSSTTNLPNKANNPPSAAGTNAPGSETPSDPPSNTPTPSAPAPSNTPTPEPESAPADTGAPGSETPGETPGETPSDPPSDPPSDTPTPSAPAPSNTPTPEPESAPADTGAPGSETPGETPGKTPSDPPSDPPSDTPTPSAPAPSNTPTPEPESAPADTGAPGSETPGETPGETPSDPPSDPPSDTPTPSAPAPSNTPTPEPEAAPQNNDTAGGCNPAHPGSCPTAHASTTLATKTRTKTKTKTRTSSATPTATSDGHKSGHHGHGHRHHHKEEEQGDDDDECDASE